MNYDKETLYDLYHNKELSTTEIAEIFDKDPSTIWHRLKKFNIKTRKRGTKPDRILRRLSEKNKGENNPAWRGGRKILKGNYIGIHKPKHPHCNSQGYVPKHRLVMEEYLNRYLEPEEVVHHLDGNPRNNDIENLELLSNQSEHAKEHLSNLSRNDKGQFVSSASQR